MLDLLFGVPEGTVSTGQLVVLTVSAILFMIIQLCQPALISLHRHAGLVVGWAVGTLVFAGCFLLPLDPIGRALVAQVLAPAAVLVIHGTLIVSGLRRVALGLSDRPSHWVPRTHRIPDVDITERAETASRR